MLYREVREIVPGGAGNRVKSYREVRIPVPGGAVENPYLPRVIHMLEHSHSVPGSAAIDLDRLP